MVTEVNGNQRLGVDVENERSQSESRSWPAEAGERGARGSDSQPQLIKLDRDQCDGLNLNSHHIITYLGVLSKALQRDEVIPQKLMGELMLLVPLLPQHGLPQGSPAQQIHLFELLLAGTSHLVAFLWYVKRGTVTT